MNSETDKDAPMNPSTTGGVGIASKDKALQTVARAREKASKTASFRLAKLKKYGRGSLAYSSLQDGLKYFMDEKGYCAYTPLGDNEDSVCVLADPICSKENLRPFLESFLQGKSDPIFLHASYDTAKVLNDMGFCVNELGVETIIDIQDFTLTGNKRQKLRQSRNGAKRDKLSVLEIKQATPQIRDAFRKVSDEWRKQKVLNDNEMRFLVRPMIYDDEVDVRRFVAVKNNEIVGFVIFDPIYENNQVVGYIANHLRSKLDCNYSVVDVIITDALEVFKAEGKLKLSLGLSPLAHVDDSDEFRHSKLLKANFQYSFEKANFLYNFKNLARHKNMYRPELPGAHEEKVYCCMKVRFLLPRILNVYNVLGFDPVKQVISHLKNKLSSKFKTALNGKPLIAKPPELSLDLGLNRVVNES